DQTVRLVKALDGDTVLAEEEFAWRFGGTYDLELAVEGNRLRGKVNGELVIDVEDSDRPLTGGAVALVCEVGRTATNAVSVRPVAA
ncbi:ADP-ribosylglycohydrolase family protein, partial [Candidatus Kaiserbacteria bacterium]|nr:ADP-ribosylglycohydrolase family protein [Candidatus Kaiserbacteria bacterium]